MLALSLALALAAPDFSSSSASPEALSDAMGAAIDDVASLELALDIFGQPVWLAQEEGPPAPTPPAPPKKKAPSPSPSPASTRDDRATKPVVTTSSMAPAGSASTPQGRQIGIGLQLGYPTAVTGKYMLQSDQGIVGAIGGLSAFIYNAPALSLHGAWVMHPSLLTTGDQFAATWYIGGGANIVILGTEFATPAIPGQAWYFYRTNLWLGAVLPIGVNLVLTQQPVEIYLEAMPALMVFPRLTFGLGASLGARFYL